VRLDKERFATTTAGVAELAVWLAERGVTTVGMEATGVYWKAIVRHEVPRVRAEVRDLRCSAVAAAG
jgi:transposase